MPAVALAQGGAGFDPFTEVTARAAGTVAIAPFTNLSAEPSDDWIASGIAETLSADLERLDGISVVGREALQGLLRAAAIDVPRGGRRGVGPRGARGGRGVAGRGRLPATG